jgi:GT2 family glycosyltransferase
MERGPVAPPPTLHVGILTWNGLHHTRRCLDSLIANTTAPWRALVRDNGSSDDTPAYLRALDDPRVTVCCASENLGVSGGRNWLLDEMLPTMAEHDLVVLLDNDIEVQAGWEQPFLAAFRAQPRLGVAGRWAFSMLVHETWRDILAEQYSLDGPVDTVQGCTFWIRAAAARAVGRFDAQLGAFWHEDDDYCIRALAQGWDVRRVHTEAIVHHEHGSGAALAHNKVQGSARNQAYLAAKWRAMDAIAPNGVPRRPIPEPEAAAYDALGTALQRPIVRTEVNSARLDAQRLALGDISDTRATVLATPVARLVLQDAATRPDHIGAQARAALTRVHTILADRRGSAPHTTSATARPFSTICDPRAWDDPRWETSYRLGFQDGTGRDFYARSETAWRDGQLLHALRTLGLLQRPTRMLVLGHASERLITALSHHAESLVVLDHERPTAEQVRAHAIRPLGAATLHGDAWSDAASQSDADVVLCPNVSRFAAAEHVTALWSQLAARTRAGGVVAMAVSVRIAGPATGRWTEPALLADDTALQHAGLTRIGAFDASVSDETLLAAVPDDAPETVRPRLARQIGPHCVSLATLVTRRR